MNKSIAMLLLWVAIVAAAAATPGLLVLAIDRLLQPKCSCEMVKNHECPPP